MHSGKLLGLATGPKVCRAKPPLQLQQSYAGQFWTVLAALFCPRGFVSPGRDMIFLFVFGGTLQNSIGSGSYLAVFLTGGFAGFVLSLLFMPPSAGMGGVGRDLQCGGLCHARETAQILLAFSGTPGISRIIYFL